MKESDSRNARYRYGRGRWILDRTKLNEIANAFRVLRGRGDHRPGYVGLFAFFKMAQDMVLGLRVVRQLNEQVSQRQKERKKNPFPR